MIVVDGDRIVTTPLPPTGHVAVGRGEQCDVRVDDPTVSRQHARLHVTPALAIEDLGSANSTYVGNEPVAANAPRTIAPGDTLRFGSVVAFVEWRALRPSAPEATGPMSRVHALADRVAPSNLSVLLLGETGVGKEVLAERIHRASPRASRPFLRLHCAALAETLLESELFGHERGAFTGAIAAKPGLLASADGGTVFLDEIGELPLATQVVLLRVLETRQVTPVGGVRSRSIDVRFIAATNRDLHAEIARERFRSDLYFRLDGVTIRIPPLRERRDEIAALASRFAGTKILTDRALEALLGHSWPGNVRELRNVIERAAVLAPGQLVEPEHLVLGTMRETTRSARHERLLEVLGQCGGNQTRAARMLGIGRRTLLARLDELDVPRPRKR